MKRLGNWIGSLLKDEKGGVLLLVAVLMVVLLGMTAFAIDAGALYHAKREMVNAADATALAGAQQLYMNLTGDENQDVKSYAEGFATSNYHCDKAEVIVRLDDYEVEAITEKNVEFSFARFLGFTDSDVSARAVAKIGSQKDGNIIPIGMEKNLFNSLTLASEEDIVYFDDNPFGSGNWSWVYFEKTETPGTTVDYLDSGFDASIGDPVWTNTGANIPVGNRKENVESILDAYIANETELWIPIVEYSGEVPETGKKETIIVGFAVIILTGYNFDNPKEQTISGTIMSGIFDATAIDTGGDYNIFYPSGVALID